ncbi:MAG TPA: magnesium transporter, partial [Blastocatellia bacterium]|nr:magnesium transporter [Blastocatellia bacterium]
FKESLVGLTNGLVVGLAAFLIISAWFSWELALVLGLTMVFSLLVAGMLGALVPVALKRFRVDPALASSVFVVTITDVITFFVYLGIATLLLRYLGL